MPHVTFVICTRILGLRYWVSLALCARKVERKRGSTGFHRRMITMSNEVNIVETAYGTLDPGLWVEVYDWSGNYNATRVKARFFTVAPDPWIPIGGGVLVEFQPNKLDLEITRTWATVWVGSDGS